MSKHEWEQKTEEFEAYTPSILTSDLQPSHSGKSSHSEVSAPYHVHLPSALTTSTSSPNVPNFHFIPPSSEAPYYVEVNDADTETIYVKDVTPMFRNAFMGQDQQETTTRPYDPLHLEVSLIHYLAETSFLFDFADGNRQTERIVHMSRSNGFRRMVSFCGET